MNAQKDNEGKVARFWRLPSLIVLISYSIFLIYYCVWNFWWLVDVEATVLNGLWYGGFLELNFWPYIVIWLVCIIVAFLWLLIYRMAIIHIREIVIIFKGGLIAFFERITWILITIFIWIFLIINILAVYYAFY